MISFLGYHNECILIKLISFDEKPAILSIFVRIVRHLRNTDAFHRKTEV